MQLFIKITEYNNWDLNSDAVCDTLFAEQRLLRLRGRDTAGNDAVFRLEFADRAAGGIAENAVRRRV